VFWAGAPIYQGNNSYYQYNQSYQLAGTMYATALSGTTITSMLAAAEGGSDDGVKTYSSSTVMSPSSTTGSTTSANDSSNRRYGVMQLMGGFIRENVKRHLGPDIFASFGEPYTPMLERLTVLIVLFLIALYMVRRKIHIKI